MSLKSNGGRPPRTGAGRPPLRRRAAPAAALVFLLPLGLASQSPVPAPAQIERRLAAMGTWLDLTVEAPTRAGALAASEAAARAIADVEARLSTWREDSELARLNAHPVGEPFPLSDALRADLHRARQLHELTGGAFDPAVGALVEAWALRTGGRVPTESELEAARIPGGFGALVLDGATARRAHPRLRVEEGGFGKGAGLDAALAALSAAGATRASVDLGGQVAVLGARERPFAWSIADPRDRGRPLLSARLESGSLSTSGNSERAILVAGVRHGHLLDPRTGRPAPDLGSVTVWAADGFTADALSTALFVLGPERALAWAAAHEGCEALVLEPGPGGRVRARATPGLRERLTPLDDAVAIEPLSTDPRALGSRSDPVRRPE